MTLTLMPTVSQHTDFSPRITVIGVGGGGSNAVNNMIAMGLDGVEFVVANTDSQALMHSRAERRVQLGPHLTQGLGAGAKPEIGRAAAEEAMEELARHLEGCHMVFITAGMGGGTGTGAAPVIARMARERGVLTVGVVTRPFDFEGRKRRALAEAGIDELQRVVDTLIIIPNQNLFRLANERTTFVEAFKLADNVLYMGVRGVTDLMVNPGVVNLDFADIRTVMAEMGKAMMGTGEAEGEDRAIKASESAISNPLLDDISMQGARGVLINITGGHDMTLFEVDAAANRIRSEVDEDANIIFGSSVDETMNGRIRVSVVATGIDAVAVTQADAQARPEGLTVVAGGRAAAPVAAVTAGTAPVVAHASVAASATTGAATGGATLPQRRATTGGGAAALRPATMAQAEAVAPAVQAATPEPAEPIAALRPVAEPATRQPMPAPAPAGGSRIGNIFRAVTGGSGGLMRRHLPDAPAAKPAAATTRTEAPAPHSIPALRPAAQMPRPVQQDANELEIPTFLRRQSN